MDAIRYPHSSSDEDVFMSLAHDHRQEWFSFRRGPGIDAPGAQRAFVRNVLAQRGLSAADAAVERLELQLTGFEKEVSPSDNDRLAVLAEPLSKDPACAPPRRGSFDRLREAVVTEYANDDVTALRIRCLANALEKKVNALILPKYMWKRA